ncbi:MAG: type II secretion system GspH family protein [Muribaculaceae bacterium]|nr:type II secretion system GspH family protein [Muribaculaceae bacterium]
MKQESGRSMIEMLGVLAIMGVITVGAIGAISMAMRTQKRATVEEEVFQMVAGVRQLLGGYDDFSHIDNATIFGAIGMKNKNPYGGTYELSVDPSNSRQFIVSINGLTQSDCRALVTKAWQDSVGYQMSGNKEGGASGRCTDADGKNIVQITFGE